MRDFKMIVDEKILGCDFRTDKDKEETISSWISPDFSQNIKKIPELCIKCSRLDEDCTTMKEINENAESCDKFKEK